MNILDQIIANKKIEVTNNKELFPYKLLEKSLYFHAPGVSLKKYIQRADKSGIIAEIKRKSPSKGNINKYVDVERTSIGYMQAGASALSVLTDTVFFGGKNEDLSLSRKYNYCPILRKDFTIDEYQIIEAKSIGADAILLLANVLNHKEIKHFTQLAHGLGLEVVLELREEEELSKYCDDVDLVGVNNRGLQHFEVNLERSHLFAGRLPKNKVKIAESGIQSAKDLIELKKLGYEGFLIGEKFMKAGRPELACAAFIQEVRELLGENFKN